MKQYTLEQCKRILGNMDVLSVIDGLEHSVACEFCKGKIEFEDAQALSVMHWATQLDILEYGIEAEKELEKKNTMYGGPLSWAKETLKEMEKMLKQASMCG